MSSSMGRPTRMFTTTVSSACGSVRFSTSAKSPIPLRSARTNGSGIPACNSSSACCRLALPSPTAKTCVPVRMPFISRHSASLQAPQQFGLVSILPVNGYNARHENLSPLFASTQKVELNNAKGDSVGTAALRRSGKGVEIKLNLHDLPAGEHAIQIHQTPKCDSPDFKSAGGHFNPEGKKHGLDNPEGPHAGDMPNFIVDHNGKAKNIVVRDPRVSLGKGSNSVFSNGGTALVIHAKPDDMKTDPAGNAGDRIAC